MAYIVDGPYGDYKPGGKRNPIMSKRKIKPGFTDERIEIFGLAGARCPGCNDKFVRGEYYYHHSEEPFGAHCEDCATEPVGGLLYREDYEKTELSLDTYGCNSTELHIDSHDVFCCEMYEPKPVGRGLGWICEKHWKELPSKDEELCKVFRAGGQPNPQHWTWWEDPYPCEIKVKPSRNLSTNLKEKAMSVAKTLKNLSKGKDQKLLEEYGVVLEDGTLTDEGTETVAQYVFDAKDSSVRKQIVEDLEKVKAERKKEC